jgi:putative transposase
MSKKGRRYTPEQIIAILCEAEVLQSQGMSIEQVARKLEIASQTYYRWREEYGDMDTPQVRKLKDLEKENLQLKKLVADLSLDNAILKEVLSKK